MSVTDIFFATCVISFIMGLFALSLSYVDYVAIGYLINATNSLPNTPGVLSLLQNTQQLSLFWPDIAALATIILILESWILSFFIKAHPLAAVSGVFMLFAYTIVSFFISNTAIGLARMAIFAPIISNANPLLLIWINAPILCVIGGVVDIAIALTAARG